MRFVGYDEDNCKEKGRILSRAARPRFRTARAGKGHLPR